jgi:hypothetical protein
LELVGGGHDSRENHQEKWHARRNFINKRRPGEVFDVLCRHFLGELALDKTFFSERALNRAMDKEKICLSTNLVLKFALHVALQSCMSSFAVIQALQ